MGLPSMLALIHYSCSRIISASLSAVVLALHVMVDVYALHPSSVISLISVVEIAQWKMVFKMCDLKKLRLRILSRVLNLGTSW
jgi:hypothetical protein